MSKKCLICEKRAYSDYCVRHKPRKFINNESASYKAKRQACARRWYEDNPPDENGEWPCYLNGLSQKCLGSINKATIKLEHVIPKVKAPELRFEPTNLKASDEFCNSVKGSWTLEQLEERYPEWDGAIL